jgi:hypothetical protein
VSPRARYAFCWLVGAGWLGNLVAGMIPALEYEPSALVTAPMMLVLGAVFAAARKDETAAARQKGRHRGE